MSWYCKKCSFINQDSEVFCSQCGQERTITQFEIKDREQVTEKKQNEAVKPTRKYSWIGLGLIFGLSIGLIIAASIYGVVKFVIPQYYSQYSYYQETPKQVIYSKKQDAIPALPKDNKPIREDYLYTKTSDVPLYQWSAIDSRIKAKLPKGTAVVNKGRQSIFYRVQVSIGGKILNGFIKTSDLQYTKP